MSAYYRTGPPGLKRRNRPGKGGLLSEICQGLGGDDGAENSHTAERSQDGIVIAARRPLRWGPR
jgi:hypothetical protein